MKIAQFLVGSIDNSGYIRQDLNEIVDDLAFTQNIDVSIERIKKILLTVQSLDPPGVGARDYRDMLLLQLRNHMPFHDVMRVLIRDHLEDIANNRLPVIQKATDFSLDMIKVGIEQIQTLNPYPGRGFEQRPVQRVTPDLSLEKDESGKYVVKLLDEYVPELRISPRYRKMLQGNPPAETYEWIKKKVESARWLIEAIEQRYSTLRKVAQEIINHQKDFLDHGPEHIAPLKMQQIADRVGVHVTTVSRAVDEKWIQTPRGLFPLKRFFKHGTQTSSGEDIAWETIGIRLQELIDEEDKKKPLSDDALVDALGKQGLTLARRTITKYRKKMGIPSSRKRREY